MFSVLGRGQYFGGKRDPGELWACRGGRCVHTYLLSCAHTCPLPCAHAHPLLCTHTCCTPTSTPAHSPVYTHHMLTCAHSTLLCTHICAYLPTLPCTHVHTHCMHSQLNLCTSHPLTCAHATCTPAHSPPRTHERTCVHLPILRASAYAMAHRPPPRLSSRVHAPLCAQPSASADSPCATWPALQQQRKPFVRAHISCSALLGRTWLPFSGTLTQQKHP